MKSFIDTLLVFLRLGLTSFGGPVAHLGYFREEFVVRRKWIEEQAFIDLVALSQFLPGPSSSQVNLAIGWHRGGWTGALAAWVGFTLPSAILMVALGYGLGSIGGLSHAGWLLGLKIAAVAVVAQAVWAMAIRFWSERLTAVIGLGAAAVVLGWACPYNQVMTILVGSFLGWMFFRQPGNLTRTPVGPAIQVGYGPKSGSILLALFFILLGGLPVLSSLVPSPALTTFDRFYRVGSLVFGGGHVVLPLLQTAVVTPGWVDPDQFLAGYGAAQAVPGPLFTFTAFLGTIMKPEPHGWMGGVWCLLAIYVPATLLIFGALPFWEKLRQQTGAQAALKGANAAVVGLLLAALCHPIWTSSVQDLRELIMAGVAFALLVFGKWAPWLVVAVMAVSGWVLLGPS